MDVELCCVKDVLVLELDDGVDSCCEVLPVLELTVLGPTGEAVLPLNCASMRKEERPTTMTRTAARVGLLVRLVMTPFSSLAAHDLTAGSQLSQISVAVPINGGGGAFALKPRELPSHHSLLPSLKTLSLELISVDNVAIATSAYDEKDRKYRLGKVEKTEIRVLKAAMDCVLATLVGLLSCRNGLKRPQE